MRPVPPTLGRYEIGRLIGAGASGEVYLASLHGAMGFQKRFALKVFADDRPGADPRQLGQFVNEGMLGEHLQHPNIVSVVEFGEHEGRFFLVMEFIDGISLRGVFELCEGRGVALPEEAVCELGVQVCAGLDHAHRATGRDGSPLQLVHRDLKPANLILDHTGTARILDFGVARVAASPYYTTAMGEIRGTPAYMAPEQVRATAAPTPALDSYALGLVLCEAATGQPVFIDQDIEALLRKVLAADTAEALELLADRAPGLHPVVARALAAAPGERYPSAAAMGDELRRVWLGHGARARLGEVAVATLGLRPDRITAAPSNPRRGEPTLAVPAIPAASEAGPVTWSRFRRAFAEQLGDVDGAEEPGEPSSGAGQRPAPRVPGWSVLVAVLVVAALVPALGVPLYHAFTPADEGGAAVVPGGAGPTAEAPTPASAPPASHDPVDAPPPAAGDVPTGAPAPEKQEAPEAAPLPSSPVPVAGVGAFQVNSRPWSEVWVDGDRVGTTGSPSFETPAGPHTVVLIQPGSGDRKRYDVEIPPDATVKLGCWDFRAGARCGE